MKNNRVAVGGLSLSAAAFVAILGYEGYSSKAYIPIEGDKTTIGFGSTVYETGSPVKAGDTIEPVRASVLALNHISKDEKRLAECLSGAEVYQHEWDAVVSWAYNVGVHAACNSTLAKKLKSGDHEGACNELPRWRFSGGKEIRGLAIRREKERLVCLGLSDDAPYGGK